MITYPHYANPSWRVRLYRRLITALIRFFVALNCDGGEHTMRPGTRQCYCGKNLKPGYAG